MDGVVHDFQSNKNDFSGFATFLIGCETPAAIAVEYRGFDSRLLPLLWPATAEFGRTRYSNAAARIVSTKNVKNCLGIYPEPMKLDM